VVKFDEKTLAAERKVYPFILFIGLIILAVAVLMVGSLALASAAVTAGIGIAFFSAGFFWWVDRTFHEDD